MKAFVLSGPREFSIDDVPNPVAEPGQVVVNIERVGVCGTDIEFFDGDMSYLHSGQAAYPIRLGHEWCGVVSSVGTQVDESWVGRRVTGDTMLGCGRCGRCLSGRHYVCEFRYEIGVRGGWPGALAEQLAVPVDSLHVLPDSVDATAGALVEPGGNALRAAWGADIHDGDRVLVLGAGTIGLLTAQFARAMGAELHVAGRSQRSLVCARSLDFPGVWTSDAIPQLPWDAIIDASNAPSLPARALELVEPGKRVVYVGLAGRPSLIDTRELALKDVTAVGILGASAGLDGAIERFASGAVVPHNLVASTVGLERVGDVLAGWRPADSGSGPKIHVDPRI